MVQPVLRTLIVDDSPVFRQVLTETLLSRFPSMQIFEAANGSQALEQVDAHSPDLIFMDIRLPDVSGLELTQKIKLKYPEMTVVILTNYDLPEYRDAALRYKATHFIPKDSFLAMADIILSWTPK
jgi:DNA-binding NarL/FixJ family response regulator